MTGPGKPEACATASTPPHSASSPPETWNAKATAPTASSSNRQTTPAAHRDDHVGHPCRRPPHPGPPSKSFAMPSSAPPADRGHAETGGLVENGAHQRDLINLR